jgi:hypothetical protein
MERAEFAAGSIEVRGSGPVHRFLGFLGAFFLGIGPDAHAGRDAENWWDREPGAARDDATPLVLGRQAELFDAAGQAVAAPVARPAAPVPAPVAAPAAARTLVSVHAKSRTGARVVATTRAVAATRVAAVTKTAAGARGEVGRHLVMSQSLSSGREESRWFSVPQRTLLPRFQLFEGADAVVEEQGSLRIGSPALKTQRGRVWFV